MSDGVIIEDGIVKGFHIPEDEAWKLVPDFARDNDYPFFRTTVDFVMAQVMEYAKLKKANADGTDLKNAWDKIAYDLDKSELLARLLDGKPMFTYPPPKSYKSHWYELVENKRAIPISVKFSEWKHGTGNKEPTSRTEYAIIDENAWDILDTLSDETFRVRYHEKAPQFILRRATEDELDVLLHPRQYRGKDSYQWILVQETP